MEWGNFYLVVGGAAGALVGLQFVVMTLISGRATVARPPEAAAAFATPTIVHFGASLFLSALMLAPWWSFTAFAVVLGLFGLAGTSYSIIVSLRIRSQTAYQPEFEDWLFHCILPTGAYALIAIGILTEVVLASYRAQELFCIGASSLLLLLTGIHNAWDAVTYHVFSLPAPDESDGEQNTDGSDESKS